MTLGLPLIGGMLAQTAITLTDTVMMGWYGVEELAAGWRLGGSSLPRGADPRDGFRPRRDPMVAAAAANDDRRQVRRITRMGLWIALIFSALVDAAVLVLGGAVAGARPDGTVAAGHPALPRIAGWGSRPRC